MPIAIVPMPGTTGTLTMTLTWGFAVLSSSMSCARSSIEYRSWLLDGLIRSEPICALRARAIAAVTFEPGRCPPSPGLAPWPILISTSSEELISSEETPKRPEAICWPRCLGYWPIMSGISPPSPLTESMSARAAASA